MTNTFFFLQLSTSYHIEYIKSTSIFSFFDKKINQNGDKIRASVPVTQVSSLFVKVYFYEQIVESAISSSKDN